ncbi:hypothetical protein NPIL_127841 [Nephila pilipes]|uniref:Uncharacterized protein n=1 Tax=Nephila pilipes TaxID=299642 RepID=A0A8X6NQ30_NEPPI|nr:hypothetical protein NPIL_127841 [Nephila pilipes]
MKNCFAPLSNDDPIATEKDLPLSLAPKTQSIMLKKSAKYTLEKQRNHPNSTAKLAGESNQNLMTNTEIFLHSLKVKAENTTSSSRLVLSIRAVIKGLPWNEVPRNGCW